MTPEVKDRIEQLRHGKVPGGYKKTKYGVCPKEWGQNNLGTLGATKNGLNFHRDDSGCKLRVLGVGDFKELSILRDTNTLTEISLNMLPDEESFLRDGDIVFVRSNGSKELVGRNLLIYPGINKVSFSGFCIRYRLADNNTTTPEFINFVLDSGALKRILQNENQGSNINNLNQGILSALSIDIPTLEEQQKIVAILTLQDRVIELKEKLLAEKKRRKKYLMQQLLVGKKRLPGFSGEWEKKKLGNLFSERCETKCEDLPLLAITVG